MAVHDALRVARRTARVAHARGLVLVVDPELDGRGRGEQLLVVEQLVAGEIGRDLALPVVHQDEVPEPLEGRQQRGEERQQ